MYYLDQTRYTEKTYNPTPTITKEHILQTALADNAKVVLIPRNASTAMETYIAEALQGLCIVLRHPVVSPFTYRTISEKVLDDRDFPKIALAGLTRESLAEFAAQNNVTQLLVSACDSEALFDIAGTDYAIRTLFWPYRAIPGYAISIK